MKKIIIYIPLSIIIIVLIIFMINYKQRGNNLKFAYAEYMKLDKDEKVINPITKEISGEFYKYSVVKGSDIALNRAIKSKNISFIGVSLTLKTESFIDLLSKDSSFTKIYEKNYSDAKEQRKFHSFFLKKADKFIFRTIYTEPEYNDLIVYDILNSDSLRIFRLYQLKSYLIKKIRG